MREQIEIRDVQTAAVFSKSRQRKLLLALVPGELSLSQLSRMTQTPLNLLHHHIGKFLALGLVAVARTERRAGAPIKYYRATAKSFFVPAELMTTAPGEALHAKLRGLLSTSLARSLRGALYSNEVQGPRMKLVRDLDTRTVATELWMELHLSYSDVTKLEKDVRALLHRYEARAKKTHRPFLIHAAIVGA